MFDPPATGCRDCDQLTGRCCWRHATVTFMPYVILVPELTPSTPFEFPLTVAFPSIRTLG